MSGADVFFDSNTLLYLISADTAKAARAEELLRARGVISVQVLNEFSNIARRKHALDWDEIREALAPIRMLCRIEDLTPALYDHAAAVAKRYGYSIYDSLILAAALEADCATVYSEDMQHGQVIENTLTIRNPFRAA